MPGFELQPHLVGESVELRPLCEEDWDGLFAIASDPLIWEQHPASNRYQEAVFRKFFRQAMESGGAFLVLDRKTQQIIGSSRYAEFDPERRTIEVGWTFLARSRWGGKHNGEMKRLMLTHAFQFVDRVLFLVGPDNLRSRRALERIGARYSGRSEQASVDGKIMENLVYEIEKPTL